MININNLSIIEDGTQLAIDVETGVGFFITSILLWDMNSFKDYSLAMDVSYKIQAIDNSEVIIVTAEELGIDTFKDIWFMEVESNEPPSEECSTCADPALALTYNLLDYYMCSLNEFMKVQTKDCTNCSINLNKGLIVTINLLLDAVIHNLELGFYSDATDQINRLKKICAIDNSCIDCTKPTCSTCGSFKQIA